MAKWDVWKDYLPQVPDNYSFEPDNPDEPIPPDPPNKNGLNPMDEFFRLEEE